MLDYMYMTHSTYVYMCILHSVCIGSVVGDAVQAV